MKIDIITIFPNLFDGFLKESLLARAQKKKILKINTHNLRKWTKDRHKTVDDRPYGGGAGMVLKIQPIYDAVESLVGRKWKVESRKTKNQSTPHYPPSTRIILLSAKGKTFTQKDARRLAKYGQLIMICGRYEGVDERVAKYVADEEISIGNYVLFGGEVASMVIIEAVSRLIPDVVQKEESVKNESFSDKEAKEKEYPQYTRPEEFRPKIRNSKFEIRNSRKGWKVPKVLLSGDHKKIEEWRDSQSKDKNLSEVLR
ncbi:MAG: tRNA (guanosine(37)-N1)-methyltransferase TrmD [Candidatus Yanofskybacteria bacterium RIFCSPHIGHO2_01_FULL_43_42]|uniref:tRNA (guanine-N(1)-)-methyltransferase n=1 Tax=Candidatus Yanofskybacteria bacterium RIFCSPLOWO2_01_FULL_43_22 TaxID=1802695 RepID=A0A1F8GHN2_9BACT|nr:MAG: tRNA (guanosine(37)-N1)-methyltransferase TrmD [Candidatus Yanofskybacteria bacterium RIFCSPHIGHO2_01_FULL_43_42]OGN12453.1 MAG: tRNA (guanosine(37)-N1)-methyltransferase TrmD [Candidatus Yanofskybacteria bacterium RIFCSPHIGHO2_02_FULL_43_17]OGN24902.1 MAG: tRNA (guanosine(37)-N1)-methyltransferase TrmD [Candidatus Yanofskybacteria bacterium RIFCSPLOWO2_01_FULL_43_22]